MRQLKNVILTPNPYRDKNFHTVREAARVLKENGIDAYVIGQIIEGDEKVLL